PIHFSKKMADGNEKKTSARATNIKLKAGTKKPQDKPDLPDVSEQGKGIEKLSIESKPYVYILFLLIECIA
ncbi:hypothetical protein TNCV_683981, partial [Trichonephila clavipes]